MIGDFQAEAAHRRDAGMKLAADARPDRVALGRLAFLNALLRSPDHTGTIDDATDSEAIRFAFEDGGKWRGTVTRSLAQDGLIEKTGVAESRRTSRHCGYVSIWRLIDPVVAQTYVGRLKVALDFDARQQKTGEMAATTAPAIDDLPF